MNRHPLVRLLAVLVLVTLGATACTGGNELDDLRRELEREQEQEGEAAARVQPPPVADPTLTARVGLVVVTNSRTWGRLLSAPTDTGVVILFVQPGGPTDGSGIEVGDVLTQVDGEAVTNAERAVVQLRSRPEAIRELEFVKVGGERRTVSIEAEIPGPVDLRALHAARIEENPDDPLLRYLRAQSDGPVQESIADVEHAVELVPGFVEAISLRAELRWNRARQDPTLDAVAVETLRDQAMTDWNRAHRLDPQNTRVLVSRAQALAHLGGAATAKRDAERARSADPGFPGAHYAYALAELRLGRHEAAAEPARRAIDLNPYDVRYYELLAALFVRLDRRDDCSRTVEAIIDLVDHAPTRERMLRMCESAAPGVGG